MNDLIGKKVIHKSFGTGIIGSVSENRIKVCFEGETGEVKTFVFPDCFEKFLRAESEEVNSDIRKLLGSNRNKAADYEAEEKKQFRELQELKKNSGLN